ncbi:hypothetical protein BGZ65_004446 [Modicella reniformis]|uniref:Uncharacterized protein n=1 Tax=Modicella reniformis TaxID=1440133 RepID=A0A9P6M8X7_9FUNG|nr:hypothetical protein BGZ65_004446 [Modicella reniformis]
MEAAGAASIPMTTTNAPSSAPVLTTTTVDTINGNIREMKTKVLDFNRVKILFDAREKEIQGLNQELAKAQKEIKALQVGSSNSSTHTGEYEELRNLLVIRTQEAEAANLDAKLAKLKQNDSEEKLVKQSLKLKATEMLRIQLEAKVNDQEKLLEQVRDLQKKLDITSRRSKQEISDFKEKLMKSTAEKASRKEWLEEQKKLWEKGEERRSTQKTQELLDRVSELEQQLEDINTEQYLENEMAKEQLRGANVSLEKTVRKLEDANININSLNHRIIELRAKNSTLERQLGSQTNNNADLVDFVEEFEEVDTMNALILSASSIRSEPSSSSSSSRRSFGLSNDQLEGTLRAIESLRNHLQIHHLLSDSDSEKERVAILSEKVRVLSEEKMALQDELTRLLVQGRQSFNRPRLERVPQEDYTSHDQLATEQSADLPSDEQPVLKLPRRRGRPAKKNLEGPGGDQLAQKTMNNRGRQPQKSFELSSQDPTASIGTTMTGFTATSTKQTSRVEPTKTSLAIETLKRATTTVQAPAKRGRKRKNDIEHLSTSTKRPRQTRLPLLKRTKMAKKNQKAPEIDFSSIEIRNISVNPIIPDISNPLQYFTCMMHSAFVQDKLATMKLNTLTSILPEKLHLLFDAVQAKAKEAALKVAEFCKDNEMVEDRIGTWILQGYEPIRISASLSPCEVNIVQVICILQARFPEIGIFHKFFKAMYEVILRSASTGRLPAFTSILVRVVTGVCRAQGDIQRPRILAYDLMRELTNSKMSLNCCGAMATVWPLVFSPKTCKPEDPELFTTRAIQAVLATYQESVKKVSFGFSTLTERCSWPTVKNAPHIDGLVEELMKVVRAPDFMATCREYPRYAFAIRKALELLFVRGFDWSEFYVSYLRPELFKVIMDESRYMFFMPLVAAVARDYRYRTKASLIDHSTLKTYIENVLISQAETEHQIEAALAIVVMSDGREDSLTKVKEWLCRLDEEKKKGLPQQLVAVVR